MRKSIFRYRFIIFLILVPCSAVELAQVGLATTYYVATNGNDSYNGRYASFQGGYDGPFRTLHFASHIVKAGDAVRIRGGIYQEASSWDTSGTATQPITITNYGGEAVVIDGNYHTIPSGTLGVLLKIVGNWYKVSNLEIRYSSEYGLALSGDHCTAANIYVQKSWSWGIVCTGWHNLVDNCRAYNNSLINEFNQHPSGWGGGITACRYPQYTKIRRCTSWDNWGEGISTFESYHITIEDCVVYNNQVNVYLSDTKFTAYQRNLSYYTPGNMIQVYSTQNCIMLGDENLNPPSSDNTIINNLFLGGERNLAASGSVLKGCLIANNTFVNAQNTPSECYNILIFSGSGSNSRFINNIILQEDSVPIGTNGASGVTFSNNNWSKTPPGNCQGPGDIIGNPRLAKLGLTGPGSLTPQWFKILRSSPARNRAKVLREVKRDFFKTLRGSNPDIGAHEFR
jgi:hypothetical protein